ncbi:hypothetical protein ACT8ZV_13220 [Nocardioides sp. MAHUQ-72]|uniref:hypothetical protein n=1 Tax=unclassified Nocardioides TaxID=2615069 RepID=UPI00360D101C
MSSSYVSHQLAGGLYWRRSRWNGRACVPVVLELADGRLTMTDRKGVVLDAPVTEVAVSFSRLHTMTLQHDADRFDVVGIGANLSPSFSREQLDHLRAAQARIAGPSTSGQSAFAAGAAGAGDDAAAALGAAFSWASMKGNIEPWRSVLPAAGARTA